MLLILLLNRFARFDYDISDLKSTMESRSHFMYVPVCISQQHILCLPTVADLWLWVTPTLQGVSGMQAYRNMHHELCAVHHGHCEGLTTRKCGG